MYDDCPQLLKEFLFYMETIKGRSKTTVHAYYVDLRTFFRFLVAFESGEIKTLDKEGFAKIKISDIDLDYIKTIKIDIVFEFLHYVLNNRDNNANTRARKVSAIRAFFKYLTLTKNLLSENPVKNLEMPSIKKSLPKHLTLEDCYSLLRSVDGEYKIRDFCIITLFLNCGMRLSELVGLNTYDIKEDTILLHGKGNKERIVYLNDACKLALSDYNIFRKEHYTSIKSTSKNALFLSRLGTRISNRRVQEIVEAALMASGLSGRGYSVHKLRHTAATLMYQHANVDIRVLQEILGHVNLGTTQIYTHVSNAQMQSALQSSPLAKFKDSK